MKITIDTKAKTIQLHENVTILELVEELDKLGIGEDYKIVKDEIIVPFNPYIPFTPVYPNPWTTEPYYIHQPVITSDGTAYDESVTNIVPDTITYTTNIRYDSRDK